MAKGKNLGRLAVMALAICSNGAFKAAAATEAPAAKAYEQAVLNLSPAHYWRLNESGGSPAKDSIGNWNLTRKGAVQKAEAVGPRPPAFAGFAADNAAAAFERTKSGGLLLVDKAVDALTPTNRFSDGSVSALTLSVWFRLGEAGPKDARQVIAGFQKRAGARYSFLVLRERDGRLKCYVTDNTGDSQIIVSPYAGVTDSEWHHLVMTWDGSKLCTYLDGGAEKVFRNSNVSGALRASDGFCLGQDINDDPASALDGQVDEVALFNSALTARQVADLFAAAGKAAKASGAALATDQALPVVTAPSSPVTMPARGLCAHRGAMATHPENTLAAFREAVRLGAHMIEFDINLTKDGRIVLMHDATVDRTTDGSGRITDLTFAEIRKLDAGSWKGPQFAGEPVPTLEEALAMMPDNVWLNVHSKGNAQLAVLAAQEIARQGRTHQAFLSVGRAAATAARAACPGILVCNMQNQGHDSTYVTDTIANGDAFLQLMGQLASPEDMARLKAADVRINAFLVPKTAAELAALFEAGVEFPLVNDLGPMMEAAQELKIAPWVPKYRSQSGKLAAQ